MKFLCICDGGNVRSYAMAFVLHDLRGQEAIPIGRLRVSPETMAYFCLWAERIVIMQPHMEESVPLEFRHKIDCVDVGPDRFGLWVHPDLDALVKAGAEKLLGSLAPHRAYSNEPLPNPSAESKAQQTKESDVH